MNLRAALGVGALVAAGLFVRRRLAVREDLDWRSVDKPGDVVNIDGYGVHYIDIGHGPGMVLIHGFGGSTYSYRHLVPAFASDHRVIAVDLKGFGYSERNPEAGLSAGDQVAMLRGLLERCAVSSAVVVGHSMGAGIALRFAAAHPDMVQALVLAAAADEERRAARTRIGGLPRRVLRPALPVLAGVAASRLLKMLYVDQAKLTQEVRDEYLRPVRIKGSMDGLMAMMRDRALDTPVDYERVTMPVLILCGAQDEVVPLGAAQRLRERLPHARIVVIEGAAHGLLEERAEDCARAIRDFLSDVGVQPPERTASTSSG